MIATQIRFGNIVSYFTGWVEVNEGIITNKIELAFPDKKTNSFITIDEILDSTELEIGLKLLMVLRNDFFVPRELINFVLSLCEEYLSDYEVLFPGDNRPANNLVFLKTQNDLTIAQQIENLKTEMSEIVFEVRKSGDEQAIFFVNLYRSLIKTFYNVLITQIFDVNTYMYSFSDAIKNRAVEINLIQKIKDYILTL